MKDPVYQAFLEEVAQDAVQANSQSAILHLVADPDASGPASVYHGRFTDIEHLKPTESGGIGTSLEPIRFSLTLPPDYLRSVDPTLQLRVARLHTGLFHPNVRLGHVCLGHDFACGTALKPLLEHLYGIVASHLFATADALDDEARRHYLKHGDEIAALRAAPLWRRPVAASSHAEPVGSSRPTAEGAGR